MSNLAMGNKPGHKPEAYAKVKRWRKAEAYIQAMRFYWHRGHNARWNNYSWSDWIQRNDLRLTYYARHAPVSDGKNHPCFGDFIKVPPQWLVKAKVRGRKANKKNKNGRGGAKRALAKNTGRNAKMVWDPEARKLVPAC